jgi:glutamyl/glutaminyl-tRNA synthetase
MNTCTRLAPTVNGYMHLGHAYMALVNQAYAQERGWDFNVRFDDNQHQYIALHGAEGLQRIMVAWETDLAWLGLDVQAYTTDQELHRKTFCWLERRLPGLLRPSINALVDQLDFPVGCAYYPYVPELTVLKVIMDHRQGVGVLIRGDDLLTEYSLYRYFEDLLAFEVPIPQIFLPRLKLQAGSELKSSAYATEISKTIGNLAIQSFRRAGLQPFEVLAILADTCLVDPARGWGLANLKPQPVYDMAKWRPYVPQG